jgi:hypothetical protein
MKTEDNHELEVLIRRELRQLPDLQAPETLFHRVMLEVHSRARQPWWRRSWHGWPPAIQAVTLITLLGLATGVSYVLGLTFQEIPYEALEGVFYEWLGPLARLWELGQTVANAVLLVMKSGGQQIMLYASLCILAIYAACIGLGTAVARAVTNHAEDGRV